MGTEELVLQWYMWESSEATLVVTATGDGLMSTTKKGPSQPKEKRDWLVLILLLRRSYFVAYDTLHR
jgi:hypothetical protein